VIAVLVLGPPAAGKTTAVRTLVERSSEVAHFKVREHFAHLLAADDPVAVAHREQLRRRDVLADAVVRYAFADFLRAHAAEQVVLVEGYPRSAAQLADLRHTLVSHGGRVAGAVVFDAPDAVLHARRADRLVCPRCDHSGVRGRDISCPRCGLDLVGRPDDELARFAARVSQFRTTGMEIACLLAESDRVVVDAGLAPHALANSFRKAIQRFGCSVDDEGAPSMTREVTTEVFYGARSNEWTGTRSVADLGVPLHIEVRGLACGNLFLVPDDSASHLAGTGASPADTYAASAAKVDKIVRDRHPAVTEVLPIGAVRRDSADGRTTAFLPAAVGDDLLFSRVNGSSSPEPLDHDTAPRVLLECAPHTLLEVDLHRRHPDDLTFIERELKLDADADPRPAAQRLKLGDGVEVFSGSPTDCLHFHRIYDVGPSGLFEMTSDPNGGSALLKHKKDLGTPADPVYRRLETVEPATPESIRKVMAELDPSAEPSRVPVTPYFQRDRVRTNVFIADSRSVYVIYADHSVFLDGDYAPFTQVEIEYVGVVAHAGATVSWGNTSTPQLDSEFDLVKALVMDAYARAGLPLTPSRRRKYDWAVAEVFAPRG